MLSGPSPFPVCVPCVSATYSDLGNARAMRRDARMADSARKLVMLTGATRGLGRAMAEGFAELGHTVVGCGRSADAVAELARTPGAPHEFATVDVTREEQV